MGLTLPKFPTIFFKPSSALSDPNSSIPIPKIAQNEQMDYEVELAIILGNDAKDVREEEAMEYVLGWSCANDLTARKWQASGSQWGFAKGERVASSRMWRAGAAETRAIYWSWLALTVVGFDKFCPLGPCIVSTRSLSAPHDVSLRTELNGEVMQDGSTREMIFSVQKCVSSILLGPTSSCTYAYVESSHSCRKAPLSRQGQ